MESAFTFISAAIDRLNPILPPDRQIKTVTTDTVLFGAGSSLESIALVMLLAEVEAVVMEEAGVAITIADDRAMSQKQSPFRSVGTLAEYVATLLEEENAAHPKSAERS